MTTEISSDLLGRLQRAVFDQTLPDVIATLVDAATCNALLVRTTMSDDYNYPRLRVLNEHLKTLKHPGFIALMLVAHGTDRSRAVKRLRPQITRLRLGPEYNQTLDYDIDLAHLSGLTSLQRLILNRIPITDLSGLGDLPALHDLHLDGCDLKKGLQGIGRCAHLKELEVDKSDLTSLDGIQGCAALRTLRLDGEHPKLSDVQALAGLKNLAWFRVMNAPLDDLSALPIQTPLRSLDLSGLPITSLKGIPTVTGGITLYRLSKLTSLDGIEACPDLRRLSLSNSPITRLAPLAACTALERISLYDMDSLTDLSGISIHIEDINLNGFGALESLKTLPPFAQLEKLDIQNAHRLVDLTGIAGLPRLERLRVVGPALTDLSGLIGADTLKGLDLRGCKALKDVSPLTKLPALRAVALAETGVTRKDVAKDFRWACTWSKYPEMDKLSSRIKPAPKATKKEDRTSLVAIRRLLNSGQLDVIHQGIELLRSDPIWVDDLLASVSVVPTRPPASDHRGKDYCLDTRKLKKKAAHYIILSLLTIAKEDSEPASRLRSSIEVLTLFGTRRDTGQRPFNPSHLSQLPNLNRLSLDRYGPFLLDDPPPLLPSLTFLRLQELNGLADLRWLANADQLETLRLVNLNALNLTGLEGAKNLKKIDAWATTAPQDLSPLLALPNLEELRWGARHLDPTVVKALQDRGVNVWGLR
ncbi:MAG: hypothetical protein AAFV53_15860 [Myxococcota bacterium]